MTEAMFRTMLDRPVWHALNGPHSRFALLHGTARRFLPDIGPLAASARDDEQGMEDLAALIPQGGTLYTMQAEEHPAPDGVSIERRGALQMVAETRVTLPSAPMRPLSAIDAPAMLALATLTEPGPFALRTHELGQFWGMEEDGKLVAMAGERLRLPGYCEISAVCVHPDHRGKGHARALIAQVMRQIEKRGETPFLTSYAHNDGAIALYEKLGFRIRREMVISLLSHRPA